jgi:glucose-6-phosphate isomerase
MNRAAGAAALYAQDIAGCLAPRCKGGLDAEEWSSALADASAALARVAACHRSGRYPPFTVAGRTEDLDALGALARDIRARADDVVVLGIGGASLGGQTLCTLAPGNGPRLHFVENVDPVTWSRTLAACDLPRTLFVAISRSGGTPETASQALLAADLLARTFGEKGVAERMMVLTGPGTTPLRTLAQRFKLTVLDHDPDLSGRYSVLDNVGLLPALVAGVDVAAVREGARAVLDDLLAAPDAARCAPAAGAALNVAFAQQKNAAMSVLMVYADQLATFAAWFVQLWAESLGKDGNGTTPVRAVGTTDQHSQLQLYLDGPRDKFYTLVMLDRAGTGPAIDPALAGHDSLAYFKGRTLGDLMEAEQRATAEVLVGAGRPVRVLRLPRLDERSLGALLMHVMVETVIAAEILGVDAFDQPAVELGKVLTKRYLSGESR